jgi:branched-chain amino acid transport system substrate-binding protein
MADEAKVSRRDAITAGVGGAAVGGIVGFLAGSGGKQSGPGAAASSAGAGTIKVCGIFPLTGFLAADAQEMLNGVRMAVDEINEMGGLLGRKLVLEVLDDKTSSPEEITTEFRRAVDVVKPDVIFSGYHLASGPEFDILAAAGRLYYNLNTQERWTDLYKKDPKKYGLIFQCDPNDTWYGVGFALWLDKLVKSKQYAPKAATAAILSGDDAYDKTIADGFEAKIKDLGWTITMRESFSAGKVTDWGPMLSKVRSNPPGILFTTTYSPQDNAKLCEQFAANPMPCLVYEQYGPSVPEFMEILAKAGHPDAANGILWATVLGLLTDPVGQDFRARYQKKFGKPPGWANAGGCYDEVWVWAKSVALAGDPKDYAKVAAMSEKLVHRGVSGSISFENHAGRQYPEQTPDASLGQPHVIVQIQDRKHQVISPAPYTDSAFKLPPWFK